MQDPHFSQFPEHEILKCPRCDSSNTKFCYYNNYNLSQPRHYCKNCKRYWTKGGTLRNIPVGGASRKITKRSSSATTTAFLSSSSPSNSKRATRTAPATDQPVPVTSSAPPGLSSQQQQFFGSSASSAAHLMDSTYPRMGVSGFEQMGVAGDHQTGVSVRLADPKVESDEMRFGGLESGDMNSWSGSINEWPDLAIYTSPGGSGFQ